MAVTALVGCPSGEQRVIETLPPPAISPLKPTQPPAQAPDTSPVSIVGKRIIIDPGHGGVDPGAFTQTRSRLPEKTIVLDLGNQVARILQARGATVICTRTADTFPSLDQRARAADKYKVDLFLSIHANSARNAAASGLEVYVYTAASSDSLHAANCVLSAVKNAGLECYNMRPVPKNLHVLREHDRPAILVETGFLTNAQDARNLNSPSFRSRLAAAIADGATSYLASR